MKSQREKLNETLANLKAKAIFYRTPRKPKQYSRYATVCLIVKNKKVVARGISICSPKDSYEEGFGKDCSLGRAIKAMIHKTIEGRLDQCLPIVRYDSHLCDVFEEFTIDQREVTDADKYDVETPSIYKSCYLPILTEFEQRLLESSLKPRKKKVGVEKQWQLTKSTSVPYVATKV